MAFHFHPVRNFRYAFKGILFFFRNGTIAWLHLIAAVLTIFSGFFFQLNSTEWIEVSICIGLIFSAEMFNTAIEIIVDKISPEFHETAGKIKDISAGAVLVTAVFSLVTGGIIFIPKVLAFLNL